MTLDSLLARSGRWLRAATLVAGVGLAALASEAAPVGAPAAYGSGAAAGSGGSQGETMQGEVVQGEVVHSRTPRRHLGRWEMTQPDGTLLRVGPDSVITYLNKNLTSGQIQFAVRDDNGSLVPHVVEAIAGQQGSVTGAGLGITSPTTVYVKAVNADAQNVLVQEEHVANGFRGSSQPLASVGGVQYVLGLPTGAATGLVVGATDTPGQITIEALYDHLAPVLNQSGQPATLTFNQAAYSSTTQANIWSALNATPVANAVFKITTPSHGLAAKIVTSGDDVEVVPAGVASTSSVIPAVRSAQFATEEGALSTEAASLNERLGENTVTTPLNGYQTWTDAVSQKFGAAEANGAILATSDKPVFLEGRVTNASGQGGYAAGFTSLGSATTAAIISLDENADVHTGLCIANKTNSPITLATKAYDKISQPKGSIDLHLPPYGTQCLDRAFTTLFGWTATDDFRLEFTNQSFTADEYAAWAVITSGNDVEIRPARSLAPSNPGLNVIATAESTVKPIIDTNANYTVTITASETRLEGKITAIAVDATGDGNFLDAMDVRINYTNPQSSVTENIVIPYKGIWSGQDVTRHVKVVSSFKSGNNYITGEKDIDLPLHIQKVSELEHAWITDPAKSAQVISYFQARKQEISDLLAQGNPTCADTSQEYQQFIDIATSFPDIYFLLGDQSNRLSAWSQAAQQGGSMGCVYEAPFDGVLEMVAPFLIDNPNVANSRTSTATPTYTSTTTMGDAIHSND